MGIDFDKTLKKLTVSRDRFGIKPLFYYQEQDTLIFGSEIRVILESGLVPKVINEQYLDDYLISGDMAYSKSTAFTDIHKFPKAHYSEIDLNKSYSKIRFNEYWQLKPNLSKEKFCYQKAQKFAQEYKMLLNDAVKIRMRSDVRIGVSLSGGLDSSSIAYLCNQHHDYSKNGELISYSLVHPEVGKNDCDESKFIELVTKKLGLKAFYKVPDINSIPNSIKGISHFYEAPPNGLAVAGTFTISAAKEAGVIVTLDGQGADEQLAGYEKYIPSYLSELNFFSMVSEAFWLIWNNPEKCRSSS